MRPISVWRLLSCGCFSSALRCTAAASSQLPCARSTAALARSEIAELQAGVADSGRSLSNKPGAVAYLALKSHGVVGIDLQCPFDQADPHQEVLLGVDREPGRQRRRHGHARLDCLGGHAGRGFLVDCRLPKVLVEDLDDGMQSARAIRALEPPTPRPTKSNGFVDARRYDQAPVLPARIAREREMHVVVAPDRAQVERLAPVCRSGRREERAEQCGPPWRCGPSRSRVMPAAMPSCAGSPLLFSNGSTMTD